MPADHPYPELQQAASDWPYQPEPDLLRGRTILVTGAGDGIGSCAARTFAWYGADLMLLGRTQTKLEQVFDWITENTETDPVIVTCDLEIAQRSAFDELTTQILDHYGKLDGLLHNAGLLGPRVPLAHYDGDSWRRLMQVHVNAAFELSAALMPALEAAIDAPVLFTSSTVGRQGRAYWGAYAVSKFAVEGLAQVMADETSASSIRVATINPGATRTKMRAAAYPGEDPGTVATPEQRMAAYLYFMGPEGKTLAPAAQLDARDFPPGAESSQPAGSSG
jgi:NAD(P)-dependent dehydrogenase (short-subunit alcohol dehydrogenase family)